MQKNLMQEKSSAMKDAIELVLNHAKKLGATASEAAISAEHGFNVVVRQGEVETVEYHADREMSLTVYFGQKKGSATTTDIRPEAMITALEAACAIAKYTEEDPYAGLADKNLMATKFPDLDLYHPWKITPVEAIDLALNCEKQAFAFDKKITNSDGVTVGNFSAEFVYGNSHGFIGDGLSTLHEISCSLIAEEKGAMERDYYYSVARSADQLDSVNKIAQLAAERTVQRLGARRLSTMKVPVIFSAEMARGLLGSFLSAISGTPIYRKASFLVDSLGKQIFPKNVNFYEMPHLPRGLGSTAFDGEGVATYEKHFIKDGVLQNYILGSYSARRLGMQTTGNADGVHNLIVADHGLNFSQLLKKMQRGILVTELMGQGVNLITGDYSRGVAGFWVENGEIQYPVAEITIAGNLRDMFANLVAIANDIDVRGNVRTGSILLEEMTVAGV